NVILTNAVLMNVIDFDSLPLPLFVGVIAMILLEVITARFRSVPPEGWATFGDLTRRCAGGEVATRNTHLKTDEAILEEMRPILVNALGIDASEVVPSARFVEDLGMD